MNDHPVDPGRDDAAQPVPTSRTDAAFAAELRSRLHAATAGLEPTITFDEMIGGATDGVARPRVLAAPGPAGAIGPPLPR
jgi:hypothetical protein